MTLRSGDFGSSRRAFSARIARYWVSDMTSTDPLPRYQNVSASKRALFIAHAFSALSPFVAYTKIILLRNACLNGVTRRRHLSPEDSVPSTADHRPSRHRN